MSVIVHGPVEVTRKVDCGDVELLDYNCSQSTVIVSMYRAAAADTGIGRH